MTERWVVNASPLIALSKIDHLHLLSGLADEIAVPDTVLAEVNAGPVDDPARRALSASPLPLVSIAPDPAILAWDLGAGETAVLSWAMAKPGWTAVLDDGMARRCAHTLSVPLLGTLGIILRARRAGLINAAAPVLRALQAQGLRLDEAIVREALHRTVGESFE